MKILTLLALLPGIALAQGTDSLRAHCATVSASVRTGNPKVQKEPVWGYLARCGAEASDAIADGIIALRQSSDVALLQNYHFRAAEIMNPKVFNAILKIAEDKSASPRARASAVLSLGRITQPRKSFRLSHLESVDERGVALCARDPGSALEADPISESRLPIDFRARIENMRRSVQDERSAPEIVKIALACAF